MKRTLLALALLTLSTPASGACYIDVAVCGYASPGAAGQDLNIQPDWTLLHSHSMGMSADGTYFIEFVLQGHQKGALCWAAWSNSQGSFPCPDAGFALNEGRIERFRPAHSQ